jgi:hypothetical protein
MLRPAAGLLLLALLVGPLGAEARSAGKAQARTLAHQSQQLEYLRSSLVHAASQAELDAAMAALQGPLALWAAQLGESHAGSIYRDLPRPVYDRARAERDAVVELATALGRAPMARWCPELGLRVAAIRQSVRPPRETPYYQDALARRASVEELRRQMFREAGIDILGGITPEQQLCQQLGSGDMGPALRPAPAPPGVTWGNSGGGV